MTSLILKHRIIKQITDHCKARQTSVHEMA